jgi:hypothetical protein
VLLRLWRRWGLDPGATFAVVTLLRNGTTFLVAPDDFDPETAPGEVAPPPAPVELVGLD